MVAGLETVEAVWNEEDVRNLYRLALRREAEAEAIVQEMTAWPSDRLVRTFFTSPEFLERLEPDFQTGERPWREEETSPGELLRAWAAGRLPLSEGGRLAIVQARSWTRVYWLLFSDPQFSQVVGPELIGGAEVVAWLEKFAKADGRIEQVDGHVIRGWAVRLDDIAQSAIVEAWSGGALCSATTTNLFRRDIQDRFGGDGRFGFELSLPADMTRRNGGEVEVEVLGVPIARVRLPPEEQVLDDIAAAARELGEVRALLERLEARLPAAESGLAQPLSDYGAYAAAWRDSGLDAASSSRRGLVVVDAVGAPPRALDDTVRSLLAQTAPLERLSVALVIDSSQAALAEDLRNRCSWQGLGGVSIHLAKPSAPAQRLMAAVEQVGARGEFCLFVRAGDDLAPGAVRRIAARMDRSAQVQASKAASDHLVRAWGHTFGLPVVISNCSNNYGPRQFPEKLIPTLILKALADEPLPIYGDGSNVRDWLHVDDHARALRLMLERAEPGRTYCVGGDAERTNLQVAAAVCAALDKLKPRPDGRPHADAITLVEDRPGHDRRYAIDSGLIRAELGWRPEASFEQGMAGTVAWYLDNRDWWAPLVAARMPRRGLG